MMEMFHHTLPDGHEITLPRFENIKAGIIRKARKLGQADQVFTLLEEFLSEEDLSHVDELTQAQINELVAEWQGASKVDLGESTAS